MNIYALQKSSLEGLPILSHVVEKMFKRYRAESAALATDQYELEYSGKVNDVIPVCKYRSTQTGLRVVVAEVQGPVVNGYFCLGAFCGNKGVLTLRT